MARTPSSEAVLRVLSPALLVLATLPPSVAQEERTTFEPSIFVSQSYTDNVRFVDDEEGRDVSDSSTMVVLQLPVRHQLRRGELNFSYTGGRTVYREFDVLDNTSHRLRSGVSTTPSRLSNLSLSTYFSQTQVQGNSTSVDGEDVDFFLAGRTDRESYGATLAYRHQVGVRWRWNASVGASRASFDPIEDTDSSAILDVQDRGTYSGTLGFDRTLFRRWSAGANYGYRQTEFETDGDDETIQSIGVRFTQNLGERGSITYEIGAFERDREGLDNQEAGDFDDGGVYGGVNLGITQPVGPVQFSFGAGVRPSSGGALRGTSTNTTVSVSLGPSRPRNWYWQVTMRFTRRKSSDRTDPDLDTVAWGSSIERYVAQALGIRLSVNGADQSTDEVTDGARNGSFYYATLGLVWYPRGRTR